MFSDEETTETSETSDATEASHRRVKPIVVVVIGLVLLVPLLILLFVNSRAAPTSATRVLTREPDKKYNILFLLTDSMDGRLLDPKSPVSKQSELPFMRSLAAQGVNFVNAYVNHPICGPSRSSMYSGRPAHNTGAWNNFKAFAASPGNIHQSGHWELDPACVSSYDRDVCLKWAKEQNLTETWVENLIAGGMRVQIYGKVDIGANALSRYTFNGSVPLESGFHNRMKPGKGLKQYGRGPGLPRAATKRFPDPQPVIWSTASPDKIISSDYKTLPRCLEWLENNRNATEPWILHCSFMMPHFISTGYACDDDTLSEVSPSVPLPAWFTHPHKYPESAMHPYDRLMSLQKEMSETQGNFTEEYLQRQIRCYYAYNVKVDRLLGSVWSKAEETGNLDNTIVIYTSDHGDMAMQHRQTAKNSLREPSARVPMLIAGPRSMPSRKVTREEFEGGRIVSDLVSLLDIYPTLVDAAGGRPPRVLAGESLLPYLFETGRKRSDYVTAMYSSNYAGTNNFMLRHGRWKYLVFGHYGLEKYKDYEPQLFDLDADPDELVNLAKANPSEVHRLDALLRKVVDYESVDRSIKIEDKAIYKRFYLDARANWQLHAEWNMTYKGFSDEDNAEVQKWLDSIPDAPYLWAQ